jgi:hypothetical protein
VMVLPNYESPKFEINAATDISRGQLWFYTAHENPLECCHRIYLLVY